MPEGNFVIMYVEAGMPLDESAFCHSLTMSRSGRVRAKKHHQRMSTYLQTQRDVKDGEKDQRWSTEFYPLESRTLPRAPPNRGHVLSPYQVKKIPNWIESTEGYNSDSGYRSIEPDIKETKNNVAENSSDEKAKALERSNSLDERSQSPDSSRRVFSTMTLTRTPRRKRNKRDESSRALATRSAAEPNITQEYVRVSRRDAVADITEAYSTNGKDLLKVPLDENFNKPSRKGNTIARYRTKELPPDSDDEFFIPRSKTFSTARTLTRPFRQTKKYVTEEATKSDFTLEEMLKSKAALQAFRDFLKSEYSEENLDFWLDCEEYKTLKGAKQERMAVRIFTHYLSATAPREVNIDSEIRTETEKRLQCPDNDTFTEAQNMIYSLMKCDPFRRFLTSDKYQRVGHKMATLKKK